MCLVLKRKVHLMLHNQVAVSHREFPQAWFKDVPEHLYASRRYVCATNHYGVKSGFGQKEWESKGWIHVQAEGSIKALLRLYIKAKLRLYGSKSVLKHQGTSV